MSKIVFVSPSNTDQMLLTEAMVRYAHQDDTLVFVDAASKGDLDANIAALAANQDIIYVACNISDEESGITDAQEAALTAKLKAVTGELINYTSTDRGTTVDMSLQAWRDLFGGDTSPSPAITYTADLLGNLTPTEEAMGSYLKMAIKARYFGNLDVDATLNEILGLLDLGFVPNSNFSPAYFNKLPIVNYDTLLLTDLTNEGLAIYNYEQAKSGYIYFNRFWFTVGGVDYDGVIDDLAGTVGVAIPYGTTVTSLKAKFVASDGAKVYIGETEQTSGDTSNNFTSAKVYTVLAEAGGVKNYTVTVTLDGGSDENDFLTFSLAAQTGAATIDTDNHTVAIEVAKGTVVTALVATFTVSPNVYQTKIGGTVQVSGATANDFTNPVTYAIRAQNGDVQNWVVTVTVAGA